MPEFFLSHANEDKPIVRALKRALEQQGGTDDPVHVWVDEHELRADDGLTPEIERNITNADALLAGQRALKDDDTRSQVFGAGALRLQDWFVRVLYQEQDDPRLFTETPAPRTVEEIKTDLAHRLGELPAPSAPGFIGRSRELLALERLLRSERWALIRGQKRRLRVSPDHFRPEERLGALARSLAPVVSSQAYSL